MTTLLVVHWLHVVAAMVWSGGLLAMAFVVWPMLLRRPAAEARRWYDALLVPLAPMMGISGMTLLVLGAVRGVAYGPIRSVAMLNTPYGHGFLAGLAGTVALSVFGGWVRARYDTRVWARDAWAPGAARFVHLTNGISVAVLGCVVFVMVRMRFGV